jgi:transcription elongation GreA/GreB family factor
MATCRKTPNTMPPARSRASSKAASRSWRRSWARAEVIDPTKLSGAIKFGATVTLVWTRTPRTRSTYQIVGEAEADIERGLLNIRSPLARALIGKDEGDSVEVRPPAGSAVL